ncbi:MAG: GNAT family N-acetyltransferase [Burkholderiaceae bacterium]
MTAQGPQELVTSRLRLRQWRDQDLPAFAAMNADPEVMAHFPAALTMQESAHLMARLRTKIEENGWGLWAAQLRSSGELIGFVGLNSPDPVLPCAPCVEVGWRLLPLYWGQGYATEAARRALDFAFDELTVAEVVSFTALPNKRSQAVMKRLGMHDTGENFDHPMVAAETGLRKHVLYRILSDVHTQNRRPSH